MDWPGAGECPAKLDRRKSDVAARAPQKNLVKYKDHTLSKLHNLRFFQVFPGHRPPQPENPLPEPSTPDPRVTGRKKNYR
jgi:hypothetical protein